MNRYQYALFIGVVTGVLCCPGQRSDACCTLSDVYMSKWKFWVVPDHELVISAWEYTCVCIDRWEWEYPSGPTFLYNEGDDRCSEFGYFTLGGHFTFPSVGTYDEIRAKAYICCDPELYDSDYARVYVATMGISPSSPYPYIAVNDDDDNGNGVMDNTEPNQLAGGPIDDDLVPLELRTNVDSAWSRFDLVRLALTDDTTALNVWDQSTRTGLLIDPFDAAQTWMPGSNWSRTVYVEGRRAAGGAPYANPTLEWSYGGEGDLAGNPLQGWNGTEASKKQWIVVHVDMDMDGVKDDDYTWPGVTEETAPGGFVPLDGWAQLTVKPVSPSVDAVYRQVSFSTINDGAGTIQVWNSTKTALMTGPLSPTVDTTCWIKGTHVSSSLRDVTCA